MVVAVTGGASDRGASGVSERTPTSCCRPRSAAVPRSRANLGSRGPGVSPPPAHPPLTGRSRHGLLPGGPKLEGPVRSGNRHAAEWTRVARPKRWSPTCRLFARSARGTRRCRQSLSRPTRVGSHQGGRARSLLDARSEARPLLATYGWLPGIQTRHSSGPRSHGSGSRRRQPGRVSCSRDNSGRARGHPVVPPDPAHPAEAGPRRSPLREASHWLPSAK